MHVYNVFRLLNLSSKLPIQGVCQLFVQWDTDRRLNSFNLWTSQKVWPNEVRRRRKGWCWLFITYSIFGFQSKGFLVKETGDSHLGKTHVSWDIPIYLHSQQMEMGVLWYQNSFEQANSQLSRNEGNTQPTREMALYQF